MIDIYQLDLRQDFSTRIPSYKDILSQHECARADRYATTKLTQQFIVIRSTLRQLLADRLTDNPAEIELLTNTYGKPYLADNPCYFNVSHTSNHAVIAISNTPVGIDIESHRAINALELSNRFFNPLETRYLQALPTDQLDSAFLQIWTRKEAVLKAKGIGIAHHLDHCNVLQNPVSINNIHYYWQDLELDHIDHGTVALKQNFEASAVNVTCLQI